MSAPEEGEGDDLAPTAPMIDRVLSYDAATLNDPYLNDDAIFGKLRERLKKFTCAADEAIQTDTTSTFPEFKFQVLLHDALRKVLREAVNAGDKKR